MQDVRVITTPDGRTITIGGRGGAPSTPQAVEGLRAQRAELQAQVNQLRENRAELAATIERMGDSPGRPALQLRVAEVDQRILRLERQIDGINEQIASAPAIAMTPVVTLPPGGTFERALAREIVPITAMFTLFFLAPLAIAFARLMWKRGTAVAMRPALNEQAIVARLESLQTSVDAMSLEVERISEGQRYLTKLNAEKDKAALPR
ncbi:MAG TPA: hypothetical protein VFO66_04040 [Gemmatimonadaceae bacterium]|nr:hypothetical protein [Gemmatimonadaceae bacterium]